MAKNTSVTLVIRGKTSFCKLLEDQLSLNYNKDGKEWKTDFEITDKDSLKEIKAAGIGDRIKQKEGYLNGNPYLTFKRPEANRDGKANEPVKIVDAAGRPWDQSARIGNETVADAKFRVVDYGPGKKHGVYIQALRVLDLVPFEGGSGFEPLSENDEFFQAAQAVEAQKAAEVEEFRKDFGLDDDVDDIGDEPV